MGVLEFCGVLSGEFGYETIYLWFIVTPFKTFVNGWGS